MALFFLVAAAFFIPAQADDAGIFGNYTGTCSLRPMEHMPKRNAITCFPNKEKAFQMGDKLKLYAYTTKDQSDWWALNLLSSTYQVLFQARFEKGNVTVRSNLEPWGEKESAWIVKTTFPSLLKNAAFFPVELENSPRTLMFTIGYTKPYSFSHTAKYPATDYKYFSITKPSENGVTVAYHTHLREDPYDYEYLEISKEVWKPRG